MVPKDAKSESSEPVNIILFGKSIFADVVKWEMGRVSWLIRMGSKCNHMHPYKKEAEAERNERKKGREGKTDTGRCYAAELKDGRRGRSWKRQGNIFSPKLSRGCTALLTPRFLPGETHFGLLTKKTGDNTCWQGCGK